MALWKSKAYIRLICLSVVLLMLMGGIARGFSNPVDDSEIPYPYYAEELSEEEKNEDAAIISEEESEEPEETEEPEKIGETEEPEETEETEEAVEVEETEEEPEEYIEVTAGDYAEAHEDTYYQHIETAFEDEGYGDGEYPDTDYVDEYYTESAGEPEAAANIVRPPPQQIQANADEDYLPQTDEAEYVLPQENDAEYTGIFYFEFAAAGVMDEQIFWIEAPTVPLAGLPVFSPVGLSGWSLMNLILSVIGILVVLLAMGEFIVKERRTIHLNGLNSYNLRSIGYEENSIISRESALLVIGVFAVASVVFFVLTQDIGMQMVLFDMTTVLHASALVVQLLAWRFLRGNKEETTAEL